MGILHSKKSRDKREKLSNGVQTQVSNNSSGSGEGRKKATLQKHGSNSRLAAPLPPPKPSNSRKIVVAMYDYDARQADDLSFMKGDKMALVDDSPGDWLLAEHLVTKQKGYIPSNYITEDNNKPDSQEWWFTGDRRDADKQLMLSGNPRGTFLIRNSTDKKSYALSIRDYNDSLNEVTIRHYRIKMIESTGQVFISNKVTFSDLMELVDYYRKNSDGLCYQLTKACPKEPEAIPFKELEVKRSEIKLQKKLGQGQFGEVWAGIWRGKVDVAVKTLKTGTMSREDFLAEGETMHKLRHRRLVQLMGVCTAEDPIYIITELMVNGSMLDYLRNDEGKCLKFPQMLDMSAQIADGMAYLESKSYIHRDVRAANVLVGENFSVKVADFGLARLLDEEFYDANETAKFPIKWTAPEAALMRKFSTKSDVWSFGILLYETVTYGRMPYPGMDNMTTLEQVKNGYRMQRPTGCGYAGNFDCPPPIYDVMKSCWDKNPERRPTFSYLCNFFDNYATETEGHYEDRG